MATRPVRSARWLAVPAVAVAFLAVPPLAITPGRLSEACAKWIGFAAVLETLSVLGFVLIFKLVFAPRTKWRHSLPGALRAIGASTLLPAGGLIGPAVGARSTSCADASLTRLTRSTIAFTIITTLPGVAVLGMLGLVLWLGWLPGPHDPPRTILPAAVAVVILSSVWRIGRSPARARPSSWSTRRRGRAANQIADALTAIRDGAKEARGVLAARNWKLAGALGYYAFDNAVLWAAFQACGRTPPISVIAMGYLVGSLGSAVPLPAGLGAVEGGLIGALVLYGAPPLPAAGAVLLYRGVSLLLPVAISAGAWALLPARGLRRRKPGHPPSAAHVESAAVGP